MGAGIGAAIGGVLGGLAGFVSTGAFGYSESIQGIQQWRANHPWDYWQKVDQQEVLQAMNGYNNALMGIGATLGVFIGAIVGAKIGQPAASVPGGTAGVPQGLGAAPQKCTVQSASDIAAQIGSQLRVVYKYSHSLPPGHGYRCISKTHNFNVEIPGAGTRSVPATFCADMMLLKCPTTGETFVFK